MFSESLEKIKLIFKKEIENVKLNSIISKEFYLEEINYANGVIQKLSTSIDDILLKYLSILK